MTKEDIEYYKENAYGYAGVEDFIECNFPFSTEEEKKKMIKEMKAALKKGR